MRKGARLAAKKVSPLRDSPDSSDRTQMTGGVSPASSELPAKAASPSPPAAAAAGPARCANHSASLTQSLMKQLGLQSPAPAAPPPAAAANGTGAGPSGLCGLCNRQAEAPLPHNMLDFMPGGVSQEGCVSFRLDGGRAASFSAEALLRCCWC